MQRTFLSIFSVILLITSLAHAEWQEPADGKFSEKQLNDYLAVTKQIVADAKAAGKAMEGTQSNFTAMAVMARTTEKYKAALASKNLSEEEYTWIGTKVWEAWGTALTTKQWEKSLEDVKVQQAALTKKIEDAKTELATVQKASSENRRVLTPQAREDIIKRATEDRAFVADQLKTQIDSVKQAKEDADKYDSDAKAAEKLAANPPADVSQDDRQQYVEDRKHDAEAAQNNAKEARDRQAEGYKTQAEVQTRVDALDQRIKDPAAATNDEEKKQIQQDNEAAIASCQAQITEAQNSIKVLTESEDTVKKMQEDTLANANKDNVDLISKHMQEFADALGIKNPDPNQPQQ